jgi:hypothetical protein
MAKVTPKVIPQSLLERFYLAKQAADELKELKSQIVEMAKSGLKAQPGKFCYSLEIEPGRISPPWKEHAMTLAARLGEDPEKWEQKIRKNTPRGEPTEKLVVINQQEPVTG